jgi:uncharacterized protein
MRSARFGYIGIAATLVALMALGGATLVVNMRALAAGGSPAPQAQTFAAAGPPNTITVIGEGHATATPDTATITVGAAATRGNVHDALNVDNAEMLRLLGALHNQDVQDKDIQTSTVYVSQQSNCCPTVVSGYVASNSVTATIHHLNNVGSVIAAVVDAVGNDVTLNGVGLSVADTSAAVNAARSAAVADANARAADWAGLAGRKLGKLLSLSEVVNTQGPQPCSGGCGGGGGVPIQAGQSQITVSVTATYQFS